MLDSVAAYAAVCLIKARMLKPRLSARRISTDSAAPQARGSERFRGLMRSNDSKQYSFKPKIEIRNCAIVLHRRFSFEMSR